MEDSEEEISLPVEFFEFKLGTYDVVILVDIPHFSTPDECCCEEECNGIVSSGKGEPKEAFRVFCYLFNIRFYSRGIPRTEYSPYYKICEEPYENENHVSAFFETTFARSDVADGVRSLSIGGTLGVVDIHGNFCKRQTFGASYDIVKDINKYGVADYEIGLERFLSRKDLLEKSELFLQNDTLTVRCEITFSVNGIGETFSFLKTELFQREEIEEKWFEYAEVVDEITCEKHIQRSLVLNQDSPLGKLLQEKSPYFKCVFSTTMKEGTTKLLPIEDEEFKTFYNMVSFVRFDTFDHVRNVEECAELYVAADKYEITGLAESCRKYFRQYIKSDCVADILMFFDVYKDTKMKEFAIQFILANWYEVKLSDGWKVLEEERRDLIREILCMIEDVSSNLLPKDNQSLKDFKEEMECYSVFPKYTKSISNSKSFEEKLEIAILSQRQHFQCLEAEEEWFKHKAEGNLEQHYLNLNNPDSILCQLLQRKSLYFKNLFTTPMKEGITKLLPINQSEYPTFYNLICYVRFETLDHIRDIDECIDLYVLADKYDVADLKEYCVEYVRQNIKIGKAAEILFLADAYKDQKLKEFCIQYILTKWFNVKESDNWKILEEERPDLIQEILFIAEDKELEILPGDNEGMKAFLKEMKCYKSLPTKRELPNQSISDLTFFDLISLRNQELVIAFILEMGYQGYETANNMGYFEYKDFIYVKQEDLVREIIRLIKKEFVKIFVLKRDCLQIFKKTMEKADLDVFKRREKIASKELGSYKNWNQDIVVQSILYRWVKALFSFDWRLMRAEMVDDDANEEMKENRYKLLTLDDEFTRNKEPELQLDDLDFNDLTNVNNQIIVIEFLLAKWNEEMSYQFLNLAMKARFNLYKQSLFVHKEKEILDFTSEEIAWKFEETDEHAQIYNFYN